MKLSRNHKIWIAAIALLVIAAGGYLYSKQKISEKDIVKYNDPGLTSDEKQFFESRISEIGKNIDTGKLSNEDKYKAYIDLGANYAAIGKYEEAKNAFNSAAQLMPDNVVPWKELLALGGKMKDFGLAEKAEKKLIEIDPTNKDLYQQQYSEAIK